MSDKQKPRRKSIQVDASVRDLSSAKCGPMLRNNLLRMDVEDNKEMYEGIGCPAAQALFRARFNAATSDQTMQDILELTGIDIQTRRQAPEEKKATEELLVTREDIQKAVAEGVMQGAQTLFTTLKAAGFIMHPKQAQTLVQQEFKLH